MAHINLLPWRERLREERRREFIFFLGITLVFGLSIILMVDRYFNREINQQTARNDFLRSQISTLDQQVAEINQLRQQKEDIRARMNVIANLQGTRPVIVRVFDELVKTLPEGVFYESLERVDNTIFIQGVAESSSRITELLRRLEESVWFEGEDLGDFSANSSEESMLSSTFTFTLTFNLALPDQQSGEV